MICSSVGESVSQTDLAPLPPFVPVPVLVTAKARQTVMGRRDRRMSDPPAS